MYNDLKNEKYVSFSHIWLFFIVERFFYVLQAIVLFIFHIKHDRHTQEQLKKPTYWRVMASVRFKIAVHLRAKQWAATNKTPNRSKEKFNWISWIMHAADDEKENGKEKGQQEHWTVAKTNGDIFTYIIDIRCEWASKRIIGHITCLGSFIYLPCALVYRFL